MARKESSMVKNEESPRRSAKIVIEVLDMEKNDPTAPLLLPELQVLAP
jgi:hypothetical protein